jgi:hypothetical protein
MERQDSRLYSAYYPRLFSTRYHHVLWSADSNARHIIVFGPAVSIFIIFWAAINTHSKMSRTGGPKKERKST